MLSAKLFRDNKFTLFTNNTLHASYHQRKPVGGPFSLACVRASTFVSTNQSDKSTYDAYYCLYYWGPSSVVFYGVAAYWPLFLRPRFNAAMETRYGGFANTL